MPYLKNSHCSYCGYAFQPDQPWPRLCANCGNTSFINPLPVSVVLVPVDGGVLTVRRSIEPCKGQLALPGGYINIGETWQAAGAREVWEETGLRLEAGEMREFRVRSAPDGAVLIFGLAQPRTAAELPTFAPNEEASELMVVRAPQALAFPIHTQVLEEFFGARQTA